MFEDIFYPSAHGGDQAAFNSIRSSANSKDSGATCQETYTRPASPLEIDDSPVNCMLAMI